MVGNGDGVGLGDVAGGRAGVEIEVPTDRVLAVGGICGIGDKASEIAGAADIGVWEIFVPDIGLGRAYKYQVAAADGTTETAALLERLLPSRCFLFGAVTLTVILRSARSFMSSVRGQVTPSGSRSSGLP